MKTFFIHYRFLLLAIFVLVAGFFISLKPVVIASGGQMARFFTHASSVAVALRDAGYSISHDEIVNPPLDAPVTWGMTISVEPARQIEVSDLGSTRWVLVPSAPSDVLADVLSRAGVTLAADEFILADGVNVHPQDALGQSVRRIDIVRQVKIQVAVDGQEQQYDVLGPTVGDALWQAGVLLRAEDVADPALTVSLASLPGDAKSIRIIRAMPVTLQVDGGRISAFAAGKTVGEALARVGFALTGLDYSVPDETEALPADGNIRIVRVREELLHVQTPIPFDSKTAPAADLEIDKQKIVQAGVPGVLEHTVRVRYEDGVEVSRTPEGDQVLVPPQSRIAGYGTKLVTHAAVVDGQTITYWRVLSLYATAYSPCRSGVPGKCLHGTSGGYPAGRGIVAMVNSWWKLFNDQHIYVPGYGKAIVGDIGAGAPAGNHYWIDLGYDDSDPDSLLFSWGRWVQVYFLMPAQVNPGYVLP